ncbi:MAG: DUF4197 domain-containing protein [Betaproteobacteria bacterium]|nr:DUF4197 domain-containing protein [Betaproteobacteria bacterium]
MKRHRLFLLAALALPGLAGAGTPETVVPAQVVDVRPELLSLSAKAALERLGQTDGFLANPAVRIGLPKNFARADGILRMLGQGDKVDDLVRGMNRAAEQAIPLVAPRILAAAANLPPDAALPGPGGEALLGQAMLAAIDNVAASSDLLGAYNRLAQKLKQLAGLRGEFSSLRDYVSRKTLEGIYLSLAEEERRLRAAPLPVASQP